MAATPHKIGLKIDEIIDGLNAAWDLGLTRLHGAEADQADETGELVEKCFRRIRYLCWKKETMESLLSEFEERARQMHSQWLFKPSQERGTLPVLPVTKSFIVREVQSKTESGLIRLSESQRLELLQLLYNILKDDYELANMTDSFSTERVSVSTDSFTTAPTTPRKKTVSRKQEHYSTPTRNVLKASESVKVESDEPQLKNPMTNSSKRSLGSPSGRNKRQQTLFQYQFKPAPPPPPPPPQANPPRLDPISFETAPSPEVSAVFTSLGDDGGAASNATSMIFSQEEDSQDLLPTQELTELLEDPQIRSFTIDSSPPDPTDLKKNTPFKVQALLHSQQPLPFWFSWEMHRLAPLLSLKPIELYKAVRKIHKKDAFSSEELWTTVKHVCHEKGLRLPLKSELPIWLTQQNTYWDDKTNKVAHLTAVLDWNNDPSDCLFQLRLNVIKLEESCRFHRKFGADRFIVLSVPDFSSYPSWLSRSNRDVTPLHKKITDFLASSSHYIAGRYWRICSVEEEKKKSRAKKGPQRSKLILFAETGFDIVPRPLLRLNVPDLKINGRHREIMVQDVMQWHMPIEANFYSMDLKLFSRWGIGFSKTTPTVELYQHEFLYLPDEPGRPVMNDGCALMSLSLAMAIWVAYGGSGQPPSAVQGRIAGAKGLWLVDYHNKYPNVSERDYWIEVSDSQLKIKPHPHDRAGADASQRTFEVLKYATDATSSRLNVQLINILEDRGVPRRVLQDALVSDLESYSKSLRNAMRDPDALRTWLQQQGGSSRSEASKMLGAFPLNRREQMIMLLEAGFHPQECAKLIKNAFSLLSDHMSWYMEKLRVQIPDSTIVFCAPDPLGVLAEDEIFIGLPNSILNPVTGKSESMLNGLEVLVARNPAYLPSDIQRRKAVYKSELRDYKNVILFPTQGTVPLASLLSGGDYDGDRCQVIWDPKFVTHFQSVEVPQMPSEVDCGMVQMSRPIHEIFHPDRRPKEALEDFLKGCVAFNARSGPLGICTAEHEKLVYNLSLVKQSNKLLHAGVVKLAALAGYLVDSNKQGWTLSEEVLRKLSGEASNGIVLLKPAFKGDHAPRKVSGTYPNVIDFLKFDVAEKLKDQALGEFQELSADEKVLNYDISLSKFWHYWYQPIADHTDEMRRRRALRSGRSEYKGKEPAVTDIETLIDMLDGDKGLREVISEVKELWTSLASPARFESTQDEPADSSSFFLAVQNVYEKFRAIEPKNLKHELHRRYEVEKEHLFSDWALLRASCLHYYACHKGVFPVWVWFVAGRELCWLKASQRANGVRPVVSGIHGLYKVDTRHARALLDGSAYEAGSTDNAVDDGDLIDDEDIELE